MNRKGFSQTILIIVIGILIIGFGIYFLISKKSASKNSEGSSQETYKTTTLKTNAESETTTKESASPIPIKSLENSIISLTEYGHGSFSVPTSIQRGTKITLKWTSDKYNLGWGNIATICLIGLDDQKQLIKLRENENLCYPDLQLSLATTTLSSGEFKWLSSDNSSKFITSPKSYQLSVRVLDSLPPEGRSEWAGLIYESTSNEFTFK